MAECEAVGIDGSSRDVIALGPVVLAVEIGYFADVDHVKGYGIVAVAACGESGSHGGGKCDSKEFGNFHRVVFIRKYF